MGLCSLHDPFFIKFFLEGSESLVNGFSDTDFYAGHLISPMGSVQKLLLLYDKWGFKSREPALKTPRQRKIDDFDEPLRSL